MVVLGLHVNGAGVCVDMVLRVSAFARNTRTYSLAMMRGVFLHYFPEKGPCLRRCGLTNKVYIGATLGTYLRLSLLRNCPKSPSSFFLV